MREEAKVVKSFVPLILSVAPGQSIEWSNPATGVPSKIPYNGSLVGQAARNWPDAGIIEPTEEEARYFQRAGASRIFWADKQWSILGKAPALPKVTATIDAAPQPEIDPGVAQLERDYAAPIDTPEPTDEELENQVYARLRDRIIELDGEPVTLSQLKRKLGKTLLAHYSQLIEDLLFEDERFDCEPKQTNSGQKAFVFRLKKVISE